MTFGTIKKNTVSEEITERLLTLIKEKALQPGDKLPSERELATTLQVSRPSLREALRALSIMNVVEIRQGAGTYVSSLEPELLLEPLDFVFALDNSIFRDLFAARKIVEVGIAGLAAEQITDDEIAELEEWLHISVENVEKLEVFLEADLKIHEIITEAARNPLLKRFMVSIRQLGLASRKRTVEIANVRSHTVKDHQAIVDALKSRDPKAAQEAMLHHLNSIEAELQDPSLFERDGDVTIE